jgi:hypothetical protein
LADGPHVRPETCHVRREVPDDPGEVDHVPQEPRHSAGRKRRAKTP